MHLVNRLLNDLRGLLLIQFALLVLTCTAVKTDVGDYYVQGLFLLFLLPGWLLVPAWTRRHAGLAQQYAHGMIGSVAAHGCLAAICFICGFGFTAYWLGFAILVVASGCWRMQSFSQQDGLRRLDLPWQELLVWLAVMGLVVAVFRLPRSNDILQFLLQQQDMTADRSMQPSSVGMAALGVNEPMARWRAHLWHLWPCVMAVATGLPVDGVQFRWAPIPLAFAVLVSLLHFIRSLAGRRVPLWAVVLAVFGPVVLWYRSYNAFNYSFRLTNNFCLDKDFCLFFLIPAVVYLTAGWLRGARTYVWPLLCCIPGILKFHPLTAVYLVLLLPFVVIGFRRIDQHSAAGLLLPNRQTLVVIAGTLCLFMAVWLMGDAHSSHQHVNRIINMDFNDSREGRPLHYWSGHYAAVPGNGLALDSTAWSGGKLHLRARLLLNCGLLAASHLALLIGGVQLWRTNHTYLRRRAIAFAIVLAMLWSAWLVSPVFLTRFPHYLGGYERLHWFAYTPALVAVATAATMVAGWLKPIRPTWWSLGTAALLLYSAAMFAGGQSTLLTKVRGLNSLLDFELPEQRARQKRSPDDWADRDLLSARPAYLRPSDRVLFLDTNGNDRYWLIKQGIFWSEPYAEAFALERRGEQFLLDRRTFYALLDRIELDGVKDWLDQKGVTLIIDRRPDADAAMRSLAARHQLQLTKIAAGVWRRSLSNPAESPTPQLKSSNLR